MRSSLLVVLAFVSACGSSGKPPTSNGTITTSGATKVDRGPSTLTIDADPNGLFWDDTRHALLIADDGNNRILRWTDEHGVEKIADLPAGPPKGAGVRGVAYDPTNKRLFLVDHVTKPTDAKKSVIQIRPVP